MVAESIDSPRSGTFISIIVKQNVIIISKT